MKNQPEKNVDGILRQERHCFYEGKYWRKNTECEFMFGCCK